MAKPEFFKVFMPHLCGDRMKIPEAFVPHIERKTSGGCVNLTGPSGNTWKVKLTEIMDDLFLDEGWTTFVKDHMLQVGEFLVFKFDRNLRFSVFIYGHNACEKESAFYAKCSQPCDKVDSEEMKKAIVKVETSFTEALGEPPKRIAGCSASEEVPPIHGLLRGSGSIDSTPGVYKRVDQQPANTLPKKCPYFLHRMEKYNLHCGVLHVPTDYLKKHPMKYECDEKVVFLNEKGRSQTVKIVSRENEYTFTAGWAYFAQKSNVKEGDLCMFEFAGKYEVHMQVIPPPASKNSITSQTRRNHGKLRPHCAEPFR